MGRGLLCEIGTQACNQVIDFTAAIQAAGIDATDVKLGLVCSMIAKYFNGHRQVWCERALAAFRQEAAFNDIA
ncbi:hypothetical protein RS1P1_07430 [Pseudomonas moraviensis]|nr:hypothetical protein RS1P1_07430 [Pseudomonas moraviensis]